MSLLKHLKQQTASDTALLSSQYTLSYQELVLQVEQLVVWFHQHNVSHLALIADNCIDWVIVDLASQHAEVCITPIPTFFTLEQQQHVLDSCQPDLVISDNGFNVNRLSDCPLSQLQAYQINQTAKPLLPKGTTKVTFTSGSTGQPKGVCLAFEQQFNVASALVEKINLEKPRHLAILPFSLLLENIAGIYAPLLAGGTVLIASQSERGFNGCQLNAVDKLLALISKQQPQSFILVPELLLVLIGAISQGWQAPESLAFIAVGGSKTAANVLTKAKQIGLPVYQGYGLSEVSSVVSLQSPTESFDSSSVGHLLPHLTAEIQNGELIVRDNSFLGYLGEPESWHPTFVATGDLMSIENGELYYQGRKKNVLVNSFGRNISPEWLESELMATGLFRQVMVVGDSQPYCVALLMTVDPALSEQVIKQTLVQINQTLPAYAQIGGFYRLVQAFTEHDGLLTSTGKMKRANIIEYYQTEIQRLYQPASLIESGARINTSSETPYLANKQIVEA